MNFSPPPRRVYKARAVGARRYSNSYTGHVNTQAAVAANMIKQAVIDFSAFVGKNKCAIVKELSIVDVDSLCSQNWIFRSPVTEAREVEHINETNSDWAENAHYNNWVSRHFHGLDYDWGDVAYEQLFYTLLNACKGIKLLYAPSAEKAKVLEKIMDSRRVVFNLEALGCPPQPNGMLYVDEDGSTAQCLTHRIYARGFYCTQGTARRLAKWCAANQKNIDMNDALVREKTFAEWPIANVIAPKPLAEAGFVFTSFPRNDEVKCVYCGVYLHKWEEGDDPIVDHDSNAPFCAFSSFRRTQKRRAVPAAEAEKDVTEKEGAQKEGEDVCSDYFYPCCYKEYEALEDVFKLCHA